MRLCIGSYFCHFLHFLIGVSFLLGTTICHLILPASPQPLSNCQFNPLLLIFSKQKGITVQKDAGLLGLLHGFQPTVFSYLSAVSGLCITNHVLCCIGEKSAHRSHCRTRDGFCSGIVQFLPIPKLCKWHDLFKFYVR